MFQTNQQFPQSIELSINTRSLAKIVLTGCILAEIAFVLLDYHVNFRELTAIGALQRLFNITREDGLASWFASTQTLLIGLTLWFIYRCVRHQAENRWKAPAWLILALFFIYMAVDDGAQLHERLGSTYETLSEESGNRINFPSYAWQLVFVPAFAVLMLFTLGFLWFELQGSFAKGALFLVASLLVLALGMDFIEGLEPEHRWNIYTWIGDNTDMDYWALGRFGENAYDTLRHFSKSIEEVLEMLANSILWFLVLRHLSVVAGDVRIQIG